MNAFCRAGNLSALMSDAQLPEAVKPYTNRLRALYEPTTLTPKKLSNSTLEPIGNDVLKLLKKYLNKRAEHEPCLWVLPDEWCLMSDENQIGRAPIPPRAFFYKNIEHMDVSFSTFTANPNNSFIKIKTGSSEPPLFARIYSIFVHRRSPTSSENIFDTWLQVQCFPALPKGMYNPLKQVESQELQAYLCAWGPTEDRLIKLNEVVSHCSWIMYKPNELGKWVDIPTVALVSMER